MTSSTRPTVVSVGLKLNDEVVVCEIHSDNLEKKTKKCVVRFNL